MSESQTLLLGFIAGVTILIGLPLGRVRSVKPGHGSSSTPSPSAS